MGASQCACDTSQFQKDGPPISEFQGTSNVQDDVLVKAQSSSNPPTLILHNYQTDHSRHENTFRRLKWLLSWAILCSPRELQIIEVRIGDSPSAVPSLFPEGVHEKRVKVLKTSTCFSGVLDMDLKSPRVLIVGGVLELILHICHDLHRNANVLEVALVPSLCGSSGRSGEITRPRVISHLEEILGVRMVSSVQKAVSWMIPVGAPELPPRPQGTISRFRIFLEDDGKLTEDQEEVIYLIVPENVSSVALKKIGTGWSSALKFFMTPDIIEKNVHTQGAVTFLKIGDEKEIEEELNTSNFMIQVLGNFCPQVLGYAEIGETAAIQLSLADLGLAFPESLTDIFRGAVELKENTTGPTSFLDRTNSCIDFVFGHLLSMLHNARDLQEPTFSPFEDLGFCKDLPGGITGAEEGLHMRSGWVLEKLWRRKPGDGGLASSVRSHMISILGKESMKRSRVRFMKNCDVELLNVCTELLDKHEVIDRIRSSTTAKHDRSYVHGDLHGDNVMVDEKDNVFLIDFGKTGMGHILEDVTWLESFMIFSYSTYLDDEELKDGLRLVRVLAPSSGLTVEACGQQHMNEAKMNLCTRTGIMFSVVQKLRLHLGELIRDNAKEVDGDHCRESTDQLCRVATTLLFRNSLFFMAARENKEKPQSRCLALAFACAYGEALKNMCGA